MQCGVLDGSDSNDFMMVFEVFVQLKIEFDLV